jgi:hypothetical protein
MAQKDAEIARLRALLAECREWIDACERSGHKLGFCDFYARLEAGQAAD